MRKFKIQSYFKSQTPDLSKLTMEEMLKVLDLREKINSFSSVAEKEKFIQDRRKSVEARDFDSMFFKIDRDAEFQSIIRDKNNKYKENEEEEPDQYEDIINKNKNRKKSIKKN